MRHQNRLLIALALPLMLAGCAKDDSTDPATDIGGEITFSIGFAGDEQNAQDPQTRVATDALFNSTWENGDAIGIFAVATGTTLSATAEDNYINNVRLTYNASANTWTPDQPLYWPADGGRLDFYAYHPWDGLFNDPTAIDFTVHLGQHGTTEVGGTQKSNFNASDLLTAKSNNGGSGFGKTTTSVPLTFSHALAMVQVTLDNSTGLLDTSGEITVTLRGARPTAALNLATGTATVDDTVPPADITMHRFTDPAAPAALVFRALVPAQTLPQGTSLFRTTDGTRILVSPPLAAPLTLAAGEAAKFGQEIPALPVITIETQPASVLSVIAGDIAASLTAAASVTGGGEVQYQWYSADSPTDTDGMSIYGANAATFTIPTDLPPGAYYYFCKVSATDATPVCSAVATVIVSNAVPTTAKNGRITWDGRKYILTTDPRDAGLYFKFGSVAGVFSGNGGNQLLPGTNTDGFNAGDVAWSPVGVTNWDDVPSGDASHTVDNVKEGKGDPCRLVGLDLAAIANNNPAAQFDNGTWRLPTNDENEEFVGTYDSPTDWQLLDEVNGHQFPNEDTFLPAAWGRSTSGSVNYQGANGGYWSSSADSSTTGRGLIFSSTYVNPSSYASYAYGFGVRCVRQN